MDAQGYATIWRKDETLDDLNRTLHDGNPVAELARRAAGFCDLMFEHLYPGARPQPDSRVLEFGGGVGWIMEAMLERYRLQHIVGLDISAAMVQRARERFPDPRASFLVYDGLRFPLPDDAVSTIYSISAIHHVEKHVAFLLFKEMFRVLQPGGHAVLQVLSVHHAARSSTPYERECWNHVNNEPVYWHHYYAFDELVVWFSELIGVDDLDVRPHFGVDSFFIHFSKGTGRRFLRPEVAALTYPERLKLG